MYKYTQVALGSTTDLVLCLYASDSFRPFDSSPARIFFAGADRTSSPAETEAPGPAAGGSGAYLEVAAAEDANDSIICAKIASDDIAADGGD